MSFYWQFIYTIAIIASIGEIACEYFMKAEE